MEREKIPGNTYDMCFLGERRKGKKREKKTRFSRAEICVLLEVE